MISKDQYKKLTQLDNDFHTCRDGQFVRGMITVKRQLLNDVYKEVFGKEPSGVISGCPHCCYDAVKRLMPLYFEYKNRYYSKAKKKEEEENGSQEE